MIFNILKISGKIFNMDTEDKKLIEISKNNPSNFEEVYKKYADKVFNYFWYRTSHDKDLSEDLMQETFLRAFQNLQKFRIRDYSYLTYLLTIARNILIDHYRKKSFVALDKIQEIPYEVIEKIERKSDAEALWRAIQTLSKNDRDILLMYYQDDKPIKEIATITKKSINAVKLKLSRTRKKLSDHPYLRDIIDFGDAKRTYTDPKFLKK